MFQYVLFDLDGTLTDPGEGITKSVQYALKKFGIAEDDLSKLECFIGPPLRDSFMDFYGFTAEQAEEAVKAYRERFTDIGIFENRLYEGIPRMLQACRDRGIVLAIASSKPVVFVRRILAHFAIEQYFSVIVGSNLDGTMERKEEVVQEALRQLQSPVNRDNCAMVGDRRFDVEGARQHRVFALGVSFGYGSPEELAAAGADCIVDSVDELEKVLIGGKE